LEEVLMTRTEIFEALCVLVEDRELSTQRKVCQIFSLMGKMSPEPGSGNIKDMVIDYNKHLIKRKKPKFQPTARQSLIAKEVMRKLGLI
jgi:hypothetical protein